MAKQRPKYIIKKTRYYMTGCEFQLVKGRYHKLLHEAFDYLSPFQAHICNKCITFRVYIVMQDILSPYVITEKNVRNVEHCKGKAMQSFKVQRWLS